MSDEQVSPTAKVISAVTVAVCIVLLVMLINTVILVYNSFATRDQSEQNQRHIDCIVALGSNARPESCEPVWDQLLEDRILDSLPPLDTAAPAPSP